MDGFENRGVRGGGGVPDDRAIFEDRTDSREVESEERFGEVTVDEAKEVASFFRTSVDVERPRELRSENEA